jgi:hypothetical protein
MEHRAESWDEFAKMSFAAAEIHLVSIAKSYGRMRDFDWRLTRLLCQPMARADSEAHLAKIPGAPNDPVA